MRLAMNPITIDGNVCTEAEVSVAVSNTTAVRVVPVDDNGTEYPDAALGIVGGPDEPDVAAFLATVATAATTLLAARGL